MSKKGYGSTCSAFGCTVKKGTNLLSTVKMFKFPRDKERRLQWEAAVGRKNWKPNDSSVLCNKHFITGERSNDPQHPDYVPSKFEHREECGEKQNMKIERFERSKKRKIMSDITPVEVDISSLSVETKDVSTMTDLTKNDILKMETSLQGCDTRIAQIQESARKISVSDQIFQNKKAFDFYTKLPNLMMFTGLLQFILKDWKPAVKTSLSHADQMMLVLMKLRLGLLNEDLAYRFGTYPSTVSVIFREWIKRMGEALSVFIRKPSKRTVKRNLPRCFVKANLQRVTSIIDCSEIFIQKAFNLDARAHTYSNYKHHNTVKFLISITPSGCVDFVSKLYGGRTSDKELTNLSGFLDIIDKDDVILADRGFRIDDDVRMKGAQVILPAFTKNKAQLSANEVMNSRVISRVRVHVERKIGRIKSYRILKTTWPIAYFNKINENSSTADNILIVIAALCNVARSKLI